MFKIMLDAGHGGKDSGAVGTHGGTQYLEKTYNLQQALELQRILTNYTKDGQKIEVLMTRTDDTYPTLPQRTTLANNAGVNAFISLHHNAFNNLAKGFEIYAYKQGLDGTDLANNIYNSVIDLGFFVGRGVKFKPEYHVLNATKCQAVIVESGFITSPEDIKIITGQTNTVVKAIAEGIIKTFNLQPYIIEETIPDVIVPEPPTESLPTTLDLLEKLNNIERLLLER